MIAARTLVRLGGVIDARLPVEVFTSRVKDSVMKALQNGYLPSRGGKGAILYDMLTEKFDMPAISFSTGGKKSTWRYVHLNRITPGMHSALSDWWKADRVAYRMEHGPEWDVMMRHVKENPKHWYRGQVTEPDWNDTGETGYLRVLSETDVSEWALVGASFKETPSYISKRDEALHLINTNAVLEVQCTA